MWRWPGREVGRRELSFPRCFWKVWADTRLWVQYILAEDDRTRGVAQVVGCDAGLEALECGVGTGGGPRPPCAAAGRERSGGRGVGADREVRIPSRIQRM